MITFDDFLKVDMRIGTVLNAKVNEKAKKPAYILEVDFGKEIGIKTTSAQITDKYSLDELIGMKVVGVVNFPPKQIADVKSEFLIIGSYSEGGVTLLSPNKDAQNGDKIG
jgi:tRNA-binding protein